VFGGERSLPVPAERRADAQPLRQAQLDAYAKVAVATSPKPLAPKSFAVPSAQNGVVLPKTATDAELRLWLGLVLCGASVVLIVTWRRRRHPAGGFAR
jgi:hypothetical protein